MLFVLLLGCTIILSLPFAGYVVGRRRGRSLFVERMRRMLLGYAVALGISIMGLTAAIGLQFIYSSGFAIRTTNALGFVAGLLFLGTVFCAPLLCVEFLSAGKRARSERLNLCKNCGYNLTGNVSGRCPECGTPVPDTSAEGESA